MPTLDFIEEDFEAYFTRYVTDELRSIDAAVASGAVYIVTHGDRRRVHHFTCPTLRRQLDRQTAWAEYGDLESIRQTMRQGNGPRFPDFATRAEVDALRSYVSCKTCCPDLDHVVKQRPRPSTRANNLGKQHIGRRFEGPVGSVPWILERIEQTITAAGTSTRLYAGGELVDVEPGEDIYLLSVEL